MYFIFGEQLHQIFLLSLLEKKKIAEITGVRVP